MTGTVFDSINGSIRPNNHTGSLGVAPASPPCRSSKAFPTDASRSRHIKRVAAAQKPLGYCPGATHSSGWRVCPGAGFASCPVLPVIGGLAPGADHLIIQSYVDKGPRRGVPFNRRGFAGLPRRSHGLSCPSVFASRSSGMTRWLPSSALRVHPRPGIFIQIDVAMSRSASKPFPVKSMK